MMAKSRRRLHTKGTDWLWMHCWVGLTGLLCACAGDGDADRTKTMHCFICSHRWHLVTTVTSCLAEDMIGPIPVAVADEEV